MMSFRKIYKKFIYHGPVVGFVSLIWLLLRSGLKPSRIVYPCQRFAMANIFLFGPVVFASLSLKLRKNWRLLTKLSFILSLAVFSLIILEVRLNYRTKKIIPMLSLPSFKAKAQPISNLFVIQNTPPSSSGPEDQGIDALIDLMKTNGLDFYQLIGKEDLVVIKINGQWPERGHTNTDLLRGLIYKILNHPQGFTGEVVVVDNTQFVETDLNWNPANAEDKNNTITKIVEDFASQGYKVSTYLWRLIGGDYSTTYCSDYDQGDQQDCYICDSGNDASYAKFKTAFGTKVSMKKGVWNGSSFDNNLLKFINIPIIKRHNGFGVTSAVKNFMGFLSKRCHGDFHGKITSAALMARQMVHGRMPNLHIIDAIYTSSSMGPDVGWHNNRAGVIAASTDPVALDYYVSKYVLYPISGNAPETDPSGNNIFNRYLTVSRDYLNSHGFQTTMNEDEMNVHIYDFKNVSPTPTGQATTPSPILTLSPTLLPGTSPTPTLPQVSPTSVLTPSQEATPTPACGPPGDIDCSCEVNVLDYNYLIDKYYTDDKKADLDNSGQVNALDVSILLGNWGKRCPSPISPTPTMATSQPTPRFSPTPTASSATPGGPSLTPAPTPISGARKLQYFGVETIFNLADFATLKDLGINTVVANIGVGNTNALQQHYDAASQYGMKIIIWPLGGGRCSFPWQGSGTSWDISSAHSMLDFMATHDDRFIAITIAHEPQWSCKMTNEEMETITREIKNYVKQKHGKDIKITNKINGVNDQWTKGITDIAEIWMHCTTGGKGGRGAEGDCQTALDGNDPFGRSVKQARETIERNNWSWQLIYHFQTFGMGAGGYIMPSAQEIKDWACKFAQSGNLDGLIFYTWDPESGNYNQTLHNNRYDDKGEDRWEAVKYVKENCVK